MITWITIAALAALVVGIRFGTLVTRHHAETELEKVLSGVRHEHRAELDSAKLINTDFSAKLEEWNNFADDVAKRDAVMEERLRGAEAALVRETERSNTMISQMGEAVISQRKAVDAIPAAFREPLDVLVARSPYVEPIINAPGAVPVWEALKSAPWPKLEPAPQGDGPVLALAATLWKDLANGCASLELEPAEGRLPDLTLTAINGHRTDMVIVDDSPCGYPGHAHGRYLGEPGECMGPDIPESILDAQLAFYRSQGVAVTGTTTTVTFAPVDEMFVDAGSGDPKPNWRDVVTGYVLTDDMKVVSGADPVERVYEIKPHQEGKTLALDATRLDIMAPVREKPRKTYPAKKNAVRRRKHR